MAAVTLWRICNSLPERRTTTASSRFAVERKPEHGGARCI